MTTPTKHEIENLISRLADKTVSFGCKIKIRYPKSGLAEHHQHEKFEMEENCALLPATVIMSDKGICKTFLRYVLQTGCKHCNELITKEQFNEEWNKSNWCKILGHPLGLARIMEKAHELHHFKIVELWQPLGFTKSLQAIAEEDTPESKELFEFLLSIFKK